MMTPLDPLAVAQAVASGLDDLGIGYVIGGSVAASLLGVLRSTLDLDIMIDCDAPRGFRSNWLRRIEPSSQLTACACGRTF